jgi:hypothetical protein
MRDWYSRFLLVLLAAILLGSAVAVAQQRIYGTSSTGGAVPILVDASGALLISSVLTTISFEGSTDDAYGTTVTVVDPTADRTITFPNATGTAPVFANANTTDVNLVFEGATADDHETTIAVTDPTADRTITFPNLTMTAAEFTTIVGVTAGTAAASKALVVDANVDITAGLRNIVGSGDAKFATFHVGTTAGAYCTSADAVTVAKGIVTGCTDPDPTMTPAVLLERIQQLEARRAALEGRRQ